MNNESSDNQITHTEEILGVCEEDLEIGFDMIAGSFLTVRLHLAGYLPTLANLPPAFKP